MSDESMLPILNPDDAGEAFPPIAHALIEPDGLLAVGGCLSVTRLLNAYSQGIFPWYNEEDPLLWWSPNPRLVIFPERLYVSKSLKKTLRKGIFNLRFDTAFTDVIYACAQPRTHEGNTWLSDEMQTAYSELHQQGYAHSVEAWRGDKLVGGLYGVALGQVFFGESMFNRETDASKVAFVFLIQQLQQWGYQLIDCQVHSEHLVSLGAEEISRQRFESLLHHYQNQPVNIKAWC